MIVSHGQLRISLCTQRWRTNHCIFYISPLRTCLTSDCADQQTATKEDLSFPIPTHDSLPISRKNTVKFEAFLSRYSVSHLPGLICLMVYSLIRWWLCSFKVQWRDTQSDWYSRSCSKKKKSESVTSFGNHEQPKTHVIHYQKPF